MKITRQVVRSFGLRPQHKIKQDRKRFGDFVQNLNDRSGYHFVLQKRVIPGERYTHWSIIQEEITP